METELIEGAKGIFDVVADGRMVFSKHAEQRFPETDEIIGALRKLSTKGEAPAVADARPSRRSGQTGSDSGSESCR